MTPFVLLADLGDVIKIVVTLAVPLIWFISQIVSAVKNQEKPADGKQPAQGGQGPAPDQPKPAEALSDEIDKFLKRMTNQPADEEVVDVQVLEPHEIEHAPPAPAVEPRRSPTPIVATVSPVDKEPVRLSNISDGVSSHVEQHIGSSSFDQQVSKLGAVTGQADERVEQRLHQKFDHQVGRLAEDEIYGQSGQEGALPSDSLAAPLTQSDAEASPTAISPSEVSPITDILASPEGIRRAIILNEILRRPDERW